MDLKVVIFSILFFISGLFIGSFLNILIYKLPRKLPIFKLYSICCLCRQKVPLIDSFPILSKIAGRSGKCEKCGAKIPVRFIIVEILTAVLYFFVFLTFQSSINTIIGIIFASILVVISFIDWEFMIIPNVIVLPFTIIGLVLSIIKNPSKWWLPLAFSAGAFVFMLIIHLIYPKGMGMGDVKLSLMLGAFLVKNVVAGLFIGFLIGSIAGLTLIVTKKKSLKHFIPFGPFISIGGIAAFFAGDYILSWYVGFI